MLLSSCAMIEFPGGAPRGRKYAPISERELNVRARCAFDDVQGGLGSMDLQVTKAVVERFVADIDIPKHGRCHFDLGNFVQTGRMPTVVLTSRASACVVRMWEQGPQVTVAFSNCHAHCGGDAFDYLWPILVDTRSGSCS